MNIFYLDDHIETCARYHCDAHVIKMILESAQILCTVLHMNNIQAPYRPTHKNHPCVIWANHSLSNWIWLKHLAEALNQEYRYRFHHAKNHKSFDVIMTLCAPPISDLGLTEMPQVMPEEYKDKNPVIAYRQYFITRKFHLAKWTAHDVPQWFKQ
ncbi:MAG: pyrimidine dimer DNA glycosylase/endonuclease V [Legionellaceae bacterium]|nr:pyrimidine dimer DNA glycosylase/endonuclease V [Legionellaceae bacterium]